MLIKRIAVFSPAVILCLGLVLLKMPPAWAEGEAVPAPEQKTNTAVFVSAASTMPFYAAMQKGAQEKAAQLGINLECTGPETRDAASQIENIQTEIAKGVNLIIVAPVDGSQIEPVLKEAHAKGIAVITVDAGIPDDSFVLSSIASDNLASGEVAAQILSEEITQPNAEILVASLSGISTLDERKKGFLEALAKYPHLKLAGNPLPADGEKADVVAMLQAVITEHKELAGAFAPDIVSAAAIQEALQLAELTEKVDLVTYDAGEEEVANLRSGKTKALLVQKSYEIGSTAVEYAHNYFTGDKERIEKHKLIPFILATAENMDNPEVKKWFYTATP